MIALLRGFPNSANRSPIRVPHLNWHKIILNSSISFHVLLLIHQQILSSLPSVGILVSTPFFHHNYCGNASCLHFSSNFCSNHHKLLAGSNTAQPPCALLFQSQLEQFSVGGSQIVFCPKLSETFQYHLASKPRCLERLQISHDLSLSKLL